MAKKDLGVWGILDKSTGQKRSRIGRLLEECNVAVSGCSFIFCLST